MEFEETANRILLRESWYSRIGLTKEAVDVYKYPCLY